MLQQAAQFVAFWSRPACIGRVVWPRSGRSIPPGRPCKVSGADQAVGSAGASETGSAGLASTSRCGTARSSHHL
jgi:hypothetical protein